MLNFKPHRKLAIVIAGSQCGRQGFDRRDKGVSTGAAVEKVPLANGTSDAPLRQG